MRNDLAHLKHGENLNIDDQKFNRYWKDIIDLVDSIQGLGLPHFTQETARDLHKKLNEVCLLFVNADYIIRMYLFTIMWIVINMLFFSSQMYETNLCKSQFPSQRSLSYWITFNCSGFWNS